MEQREIMEYAIKGIRAEVDKLDSDIITGKRYLEAYERGEQPKTPKTPQEIRNIIQKKREQIEELDRKRIGLEFDIEEL